MPSRHGWSVAVVLLACLAGGCSTAWGDVGGANGIERRLRDALASHGVRGAACILVNRDRFAGEYYFGLADAGASRPVTAETRFRAGSVSKSFTSLLAARLVERGLCRFDSRLVDAEIDGLALDNPWRATSPITLEQLLEHTAGLAGSTYRDYATDLANASSGRFLQHVGPLRCRWRPGAFFSYSNNGYGIAAAVLEHAAGRSFDDLVRREVFEPLGLSSATFRTDGDQPHLVATGYDRHGEPHRTWAMPMRPAGALVITPTDLARVVQMFLNRGDLPPGRERPADGDRPTAAPRYLTRETIERIEREETSLAAAEGATRGGYGLGQFGYLVGDQLYRGHWGKVGGFLTSYGYLPEQGVGFVLMVNTDQRPAMAACRELINAHLTAGLPTPIEPTSARGERTADPTGWYVNATHDMPIRDWIFRVVDQKRIEKAPGGYAVTSLSPRGSSTHLYRSAGPASFFRDATNVVTAALVEDGGDCYWSEGQAYLRVPAAQAFAWRWGFRVATLVAAACVIVIPIVAVTLRVWGRPLQSGPAATWAAAFVGSLGLVATEYLFLRFGALEGSLDDLRQLGTVSNASVTLAATSLAAVFGGVVAGGFATAQLILQRDRRSVLRLIACLPLAAAACLWLSSGWAPLMTWRP
ncbi:MAG: serine hydrolase domain-containing protein [Planctomycetota bacterium]